LPAEERQAEIARGAALFQKHCAACHTAGPSRQPIGASLENLSNRADEVLVQAILDPNAAVEPKYQNYVIQTDEGKTLAGVIESEVADSLTLAHADGKRTTVSRGEIERIQATGVSLMPEGFETTLSPAELQALVRYLQQLR
jgi:putative heme-binding domain-containing protein